MLDLSGCYVKCVECLAAIFVNAVTWWHECPMTLRPCAGPLPGGSERESSAGVHSEAGPRRGRHSGHIRLSQHSSHCLLPRWSTYKLFVFTLFSIASAGLFWDRTFIDIFVRLVFVFGGGGGGGGGGVAQHKVCDYFFYSPLRIFFIKELRFYSEHFEVVPKSYSSSA